MKHIFFMVMTTFLVVTFQNCGDSGLIGFDSSISNQADLGSSSGPSATFPVNLMGAAPEEKSVTIHVSKPVDANQARLKLLGTYDGDSDNEGELYINGTKRLDLFVGKLHDDKTTNDIVYNNLDASWFDNGPNTLLFKHTSTAGFRLAGVEVDFSTMS